MKAVDTIINESKKLSQSNVLFWLGWLLGLLGFVLALIFPAARLVFILFALIGFVLNGTQKIAGDREQKQERKRIDETAQEYAIRHPELRIVSNLNGAPQTMPARESQIIRR